MDYIAQMEKLFKFLEFNTENEDKINLTSLKRKFNNDLNLFGCFIKDFLYIENQNKKIADTNLYENFVLCFDKNQSQNEKQNFLNKLYSFSKYYIILVFEETENKNLLNAICTINSCFALDSYPYLMLLMDKYFNQKIDGNSFTMMLKLIVDIVLDHYEKIDDSGISIENFEKDMQRIICSKERLVS